VTDITAGEAVQSPAPLDALRAELDELRRRVAVNDEEIDVLQVEAATPKRKWYRQPSVLVSTLARRRHGHVQLRSGQHQCRPRDRGAGPPVGTDPAAAAGVGAVSGESGCIGRPRALVVGFDLPTAKRLATAAEGQSTSLLQKVGASKLIANIDFQSSDAAGGRVAYQRAVDLLRTPEQEVPPLIRDQQTVFAEIVWASDEFSFARNCQGARDHQAKAGQAYDRLPPDRVGGLTPSLDNLDRVLAAGCPPGIG
jgi:hypothetical protein